MFATTFMMELSVYHGKHRDNYTWFVETIKNIRKLKIQLADKETSCRDQKRS